MRVIGGNAKGRRLKVPRGQDLRPTAARVKEALFNILPHDLSGAKVLDLFAGTGNLSIEALSRGAAEAILIDSAAESGKAIRENLRKLGLSDRSKVWITPVFRSLHLLSRRGETFDFIFLDPPYENHWVGKTLQLIAQGNLLRGPGVLVAEHSIREKVEERYEPLLRRDQRRYGSTLLSFYTQEAKQTL
jgi:16S rRNA (guanine966-N2)-methyltransferase